MLMLLALVVPWSSLSRAPGHRPSRQLPLGPPAPAPQPLSLHLVVDVEIPLIFILHDHAGFLQQEVGDLAPVWLPASAELDLEVLALNPRASCQPPGSQGCSLGKDWGWVLRA